VTANSAVFNGLKDNGIVVMNCTDPKNYAFPPNASKIGVVDANAISQEVVGRILPNTVMLGALAKITGWVDKDKLAARTAEVWGEKNRQAVLRGYEEVRLIQTTDA
jgi:pyruvate ferredoxin oxidoreductase gamma subunit/phenylglyoxylate dehydrogenase gamma subunit